MTIDPRNTAHHRPRFSEGEASRLTSEHYGLNGEWSALPSDKDQNFRLTTPRGARYVVKFGHALETRETLAAQHELLDHLTASGLIVPEVVESRDGRRVIEATRIGQSIHLMHVLTYVDGTCMANVRPHSSSLIESLGRYLGRLDAAANSLDLPAAHRSHDWDLAVPDGVIARYRAALSDGAERRHVEHFLKLFGESVEPNLDSLRRCIIHNDANDHNVLVNGPENAERRVVGLIDFGDFLHSITVAEPAVAAAYAALGKPDPLRTAAHLVGAYHQEHPLLEDEMAMIYPLIGLRLCISICISAHQSRLEPENDYLLVSREPALQLLSSWSEIHPRFAEYVFRGACKLEPCPTSLAVSRWVRDHAAEVAPIVNREAQVVRDEAAEPSARTGSGITAAAERESPSITFDFSVGSPDWSFRELTEPGLAAAEILRRMTDVGATVGVGRYDEVRLVYSGEQFATPTERRTVHLGLDLFQPAGSIVVAPLEGLVHSTADNDRPFDYGPTVILEHSPPDGPTFYTLYGHLSRSSICELEEGQEIPAGGRVGVIGDLRENGGWAPHLHFQLICDLLDREGEFPGVGPPGLRDVWLSLSPDPGLLAGIAAGARAPREASVHQQEEERREVIGPSLSVSYRRPIAVRRGYMQHLFDAAGRRYLDTVNNVAHVGHSHPRINEAVSRAMRVLNTNTRYLYPELVAYAERLTATLPAPLEVCYFLNSGSEANDLALRMARAHTGRRDIAVVDQAYHGNLSSLINISPYKFMGPGGSGQPEHTHVVPLPDPLRGPRGDAAAQLAVDAINAVGGRLAAFVAESAMSCAGQVFYPKGYLRAVYGAVRASGGITIADEVQTGFGRVGCCFWAFEMQEVVPEIVTMGKPIGNGHPVAALVTTREIARSFANGMEYFNTFGGNPVACAAGLAVLDTIQTEGLQEHAGAVGEYLLERLRALVDDHPVVADVRGFGLFIGIELVRSRETAEPAREETSYVVERMREKGILTSLDGPHRNVIKFKPPLVFQRTDADAYVNTLDEVLREDFIRARLY